MELPKEKSIKVYKPLRLPYTSNGGDEN